MNIAPGRMRAFSADAWRDEEKASAGLGSQRAVMWLARILWKSLEISLIVFGAAGLIAHAFLYALKAIQNMPSDRTVIGSVQSPTTGKAVIFSSDGGGGFAPYCIDRVSIVPADVEDANAWGDDRMVFVSGCDGFQERSNRQQLVMWKSPHELQISFNPTLGARGVDYVALKAYAMNGEVSISYVIAQ